MTKEDNVKEKILQTAYALIAEKGYEKASIDEIVKRAGTSKGGFYYYFGNKEELLLEIVEFRTTRQQEQLLKNLDFNRPIEDILDSMFKVIVNMNREESWAAIYFEFMAIATRNAKVKNKMAGMYNNWRDFLKVFILSQQAKGNFKQNLDAENYAAMSIALFDGLYIQSFIDLDSFILESKLKRIKEILLK